MVTSRALAQLGKSQMSKRTEFEPGGNEHGVDLHAARWRWKFKEYPSHMPASLAPRLSTQPPMPRMAPVSIWISLAGSPIEAALICSAQGDPAFDPVDGRVIGLILWFIGADWIR